MAYDKQARSVVNTDTSFQAKRDSNRHTFSLRILGRPNTLWPIYDKYWVGYGPPGPPYGAPHGPDYCSMTNGWGPGL